MYACLGAKRRPYNGRRSVILRISCTACSMGGRAHWCRYQGGGGVWRGRPLVGKGRGTGPPTYPVIQNITLILCFHFIHFATNSKCCIRHECLRLVLARTRTHTTFILILPSRLSLWGNASHVFFSNHIRAFFFSLS